jgi:hypothetical protein
LADEYAQLSGLPIAMLRIFSAYGEKIRMKIGKCVLVGRQSMISIGGYLEMGDYCVFAPRVYVSDADHIFTDI